MGIELRWRPDFRAAIILRDADYIGSLAIERWWTEPRGDGEDAWVARVFDPMRERSVGVRVDARPEPITAERAPEMLHRVADAVERGPGPLPDPIPADLPVDGNYGRLDRLFMGWADAFERLRSLGERRDPDLEGAIYVHLVEALNWAYTVDRALHTIWDLVPSDRKALVSRDTDKKIAAALADLAERGDGAADPHRSPVFRSYFARQRTRKPYEDWASVLVAGTFHNEFFDGLNWISGKLRHTMSADMPIELRQAAVGGEPRWKWKPADAIAAADGGRGERHQRGMYVEHIQDQDVLGLLSWLIEVFVDAKWILVPLLPKSS